jgi:hypothetical protein
MPPLLAWVWEEVASEEVTVFVWSVWILAVMFIVCEFALLIYCCDVELSSSAITSAFYAKSSPLRLPIWVK